MKIVFLGTPSFAVPVLQALYRAGHTVVSVVSQPDKPQGRNKALQPSPVKAAALQLGLPILQFEKIKAAEAVRTLSTLEADVWVTAAYGQILSKALLDIPKYGVINAHASLLPKYRGPAPVNWCLVNGETKTGVTTMFTDVGIDDGDIILQKEEIILLDDTTDTLLSRLSNVAADLMLQTLSLVEQGTAPRIKQDSTKATRHPMLTKQDGALDFRQTGQDVCNKVRGMTPWPGAFSSYSGESYKFSSPYVVSQSGEPGQILCADPQKGFIIACGNDAIGFSRIQAPGKKMVSASDFLRGHHFDTKVRFGV